MTLTELATKNTIDTDNVVKELKKLVLKETKLDLDFLASVDENNRLLVKSNNFAHESHPRMYKKLYLENFNSFYHEPISENGAVNVKDIAHTWCIVLCYRYELYTKGNNGTEFATIVFTSDGSILECLLASDS